MVLLVYLQNLVSVFKILLKGLVCILSDKIKILTDDKKVLRHKFVTTNKLGMKRTIVI